MKVNELVVGNAVWFSSSVIAKVIEVKANRVVVKKLEASVNSVASFSISFYAPSSKDLFARVDIASLSDCEQYLKSKKEILKVAANKFYANFPET